MFNRMKSLFSIGFLVMLVCLSGHGGHTAFAAEKTLVFAIAGDVATIDNQQSGSERNAVVNIYDFAWCDFRTVAAPGGAVTVDCSELLPDIMWAWETEALPDGTFIKRWHVRPGAFFHSGNPVTAHDFKYSMMRRAALGRSWNDTKLGGIPPWGKGYEEAIKVVDNYTLEVHVEKNLPFFFPLWMLRTYYDSKLMKEHATKDDPWSKAFAAKNDAGSGAYVIEKWTVGSEMVLRRFDKYWGPRPPLDKVIFKTVPDLSARVLLLKNGDVDIAEKIPKREMETLRNDPNIKIVSAPSTRQVFIGMNLDIPPFDNKDLRLALSYAFPYDEIIPAVYNGAAQPLKGPIPTGLKGALSERRYKTDLELAKKHLEMAGFKEGLTLTLKWETGREENNQIGILFKENLRKIGVDLRLQQLPIGQFQTGIRTRKLDFFVGYDLSWTRTPEMVLNIFFTSPSSTNRTGYANKRLDELVFTACNEIDDDKRAGLMDQAQEIILDDIPWIFIAQPHFQIAMRSNIVGYVAQNTELHHFFTMDKLDQ